MGEVRQLVRESEVLVYAVGIDGNGAPTFMSRPRRRYAAAALPIPFPFPGGGGRGMPFRSPAAAVGRRCVRSPSDRVNASALREITDDSGGRTEIVNDPRDLDPATATIADELSKQVPTSATRAPAKGRPLAQIRVELRDPSLRSAPVGLHRDDLSQLRRSGVSSRPIGFSSRLSALRDLGSQTIRDRHPATRLSGSRLIGSPPRGRNSLARPSQSR